MLTKQDLYTLAAVGMRQQLQRVERDLAAIHKDFPDLFVGATPPQFVRLEAKATNGNGHGAAPTGWPTLRITPPEEAAAVPAQDRHAQRRRKMRASWTPERRAAQGRRIKKQMQALQAARQAVRAKVPVWYRLYTFLLTQPDRTATIATLVKHAKHPSGTLISSMLGHEDLIERVSPGTYRLTRELTEDELARVRRAPTGTHA